VLPVGGGGGSGSGDRAPLSSGGVSAPALLYRVEPEYTEEARAAKYQGTVILYVEIDPNGKAGNIEVKRSLGLGLDEKAIEAVRQWKFRPGYKDGNPVTVFATIEVNFRQL
jgi:TonB family protein